MSRKLLLNLIAGILTNLGVISVSSAAGTADVICDSETGAAYGLCTAYCDAMDCSSQDSSASEIEIACEKVSGKFEQITGSSIVCSQTCPMYVDGGFSSFKSIVTTSGTVTSCYYGYGGDNTGLIVFSEPGWPLGPYAAVWTSNYIYYGGDNTGNVPEPLLSDQYTSCELQLQLAIERDGISCGNWPPEQ